MKRIYSIIVFLTFILPQSCKQDNSQIPFVLVDFTVNINNPQYFSLTGVGGWMYFTGGAKGIVVYRKDANLFNAFDRNCPYEPQNPNAILNVQQDNITMKCAHCNSTFLLLDGSLQGGPAVNPLRKYNSTFDGSILRVFN